MKKIVCIFILAMMLASGAFAMDLDAIKRHFLNSDWKAGIREGERLLAQANRRTEGLDELYYYLALCYLKDGNYLRTSDICEILLDEFPGTRFREQAHFVLIEAYDRLDNVEKARSHAVDFLKKYPGSTHKNEVETRLSRLNERAAARALPLPIFPSPTVSAPIPAMPASLDAVPVAVNDEGPDIVLAPGLSHEAVAGNNQRLWWVQVGAFSNNRNAGRLANRLREASYKASVIKSTLKGKDVFKVRVGPYSSGDEAAAIARRLSNQGYPTKIIP